MDLKCIGGERDGLIVDVPQGYRVGDIIRVPEKLKPLFKVDLEIASQTLEIKLILYRICVLHFTNDDYMKYLVPQNWTDKQAIQYQFSK